MQEVRALVTRFLRQAADGNPPPIVFIRTSLRLDCSPHRLAGIHTTTHPNRSTSDRNSLATPTITLSRPGAQLLGSNLSALASRQIDFTLIDDTSKMETNETRSCP